MPVSLSLGIALLLLAFGCNSERDQARAAAVESASHWYPMLWGTELTQAQQEEAAQRFDCVWDAMEDENLDPAPDFACAVQRANAFGTCLTTHPDGMGQCGNTAESQCALSRAFLAAQASCRAGPP